MNIRSEIRPDFLPDTLVSISLVAVRERTEPVVLQLEQEARMVKRLADQRELGGVEPRERHEDWVVSQFDQ
jgi:hypothetical protein